MAAPLADPARGAIARRVRALRYKIRPGMLSDLAGAYAGARPGAGLTFSELKAYEPGDDPRAIDWKATARSGRPIVRRYVEERALTLWLAIDLSASMRFGPPGRTKAERAVLAALLLAGAACQSGDRAGLILAGERPIVVPPQSGVRQVWRLAHALATAPEPRTADLAVIPGQLERSKHRCGVILFTDGSPEPDPSWSRAGQRHDLIAARLVDPLEESLPDVGWLAVRDPETGRPRTLATSSPRVRASYEAAARDRRERFLRWRLSAGIDGFDLPTRPDPLGTLIRFFRARRPRP